MWLLFQYYLYKENIIPCVSYKLGVHDRICGATKVNVSNNLILISYLCENQGPARRFQTSLESHFIENAN